MNDRDIRDMINRCVEEILGLRAQVERLAPKAAAYDSISRILGLLPQQPQGAGVDIVWELRRQLADLKTSKEADNG